MTFNDIDPFTFDFTPVLKTREKIQATVCFSVGGCGLGFYLNYIPFTAFGDPEESIRQAVFAEASAVANRWALQFSSADAAVDVSAYNSLAHALVAIASSQFVIRKVIVREITVLSPPAPPPQPVKPPTPSLTDRILEPLRERVEAMDALVKELERLQQTHPDLCNDPEFGALSTTISSTNSYFSQHRKGGMLNEILFQLKAEILTYRGRK
jgi:hypothetical protein